MPLNKLENFIKNAEGRILYVNPNDLDSTDGIENQGNSLTKPFKTIQRALIEAARFSYLKGEDNDFVERTTILLFPGEHIVDNRPGFGIKSEGGQAKAVSPGGASTGALETLSLTLDSNFDLTQEDNILYKFNSVNGGVVVPRGTSIVGLDLRKTKIRPKYVPNPTDDNVKQSAIFRITGACYFWQFTMFDGDEFTTVYTDPTDFSSDNRSKPIFSHHKLTCFEYADGITRLDQFSDLTDLDIYYSKLSNAYNKAAANREITQKYPAAPKGFAPQKPEFEIVGAFATDPINITSIESGDGAVPGPVVTVVTAIPHNLSGGTPIKVRGVNSPDYNISTKVAAVINDTSFTYLLPIVQANLPAGVAGGLSAAGAQVLVETDTVTGASPYIFNISLRSVFGMQGMHADGKKATGFRSMVVAQFTAVSLQKDDRAFVKYNQNSRRYEGIIFSKQTGERLSAEASSTNATTVYHLDQEANYRKGWRTSHIKVSNDSVVQIVSVFAIGFHSHFNMINGADASITNSNSNFGTFALAAEGFKKDAFDKDDKGFITSIITPRSVNTVDRKIDYLQLRHAGGFLNYPTNLTKLYLEGQESITEPPLNIVQGFRIGAKVGETINIDKGGTTYTATVVMQQPSGVATETSEKKFEATHSDVNASRKNIFSTVGAHSLSNGESIRIFADNGKLPENIDPNTVYFAITTAGDSSLAANEIKVASSKTNASLDTPVPINTIASPLDKFNIVSRVSDKAPNDPGHPLQYDDTNNNWFLQTLAAGNTIIPAIAAGTIDNLDISYINRRDDNRGLDEKIYKLRYLVPKELVNAKDPTDGFILQDSSSTNVVSDAEFTKSEINTSNYDFDRNTRFIAQASFTSGPPARVTLRSDKVHNVNVGDQVVIRNIKCSNNPNGVDNKGYNGTFLVTDVVNRREFKYSNIDTDGVPHSPGTFVNTTHTRNNQLPRFDRNDNKANLFVYRTEVVSPYIQGVQDGIYHLFVLNSNNQMTDSSGEFSEDKFNQNIVNLYPEYDRDNVDDNPPEATSHAKNSPIGDVVTNDLKKSITRETVNNFLQTFDITDTVSTVTDNTTTATLIFNEEHSYNALKNFTGTLTGGSGHTNGTYFNIKLFSDSNQPATATWKGATADLTVSGNAVTLTGFKINQGGSAYSNGDQLYFDSSDVATGGIAGSPSANITINTADISVATDHYVQVTGITTGTDAYYRIHSIDNTKQIKVKKTAGDKILEGQQVVDLGPVGSISGTPSFTGGVTTFTTTKAHGLVVGNSFRVLNSSDANLGDFIVKSVSTEKIFTATTTSALTSPAFILKHGLSANNALSGAGGENIGARGLSVFDHDTLIATEEVTSNKSSFSVSLFDGSTTVGQILGRFPLGSYIQIDNEIMRVSKNSLSSGKITVIRGALGTITVTHPVNSLIKKIKPLAIELRRPSILRASGHTFEYVGYGPGNYSTALPQLQNRTLSEREEFLSQAQETSCGNVVYTGMNDKGDFYIGNTKIASASGQQTTFDIPIPTITGEDPNRLSIVADEVIVKERLLVEGGQSKTILSQFDGPVTFNQDVVMNDDLVVVDATSLKGNVTIGGVTEIRNDVKIKADNSEFAIQNASGTDKFTVDTDNGNTIIEGNLTVNGNVIGDGQTDLSGFNNVTATAFFGDGAGLTNTGATLSSSGTDGDEQRVVLTHQTSGTMTKGTTDGDLTFVSSSNTLKATNIVGALTGNVTGNVTGDLTGTALLAENIDIPGQRIPFNSTAATTTSSANLQFINPQLTGTNLEIKLNDNKRIIFGTDGDMVMLHDDTNGGITNSKGDLTIKGGTQDGDGVLIRTNDSNDHEIAKFEKDSNGGAGRFTLLHAGQPRIESNNSRTEIKNGDLAVIGHDLIAFASSDRNLKDNITIIPNALDKVNAISGNTFTWKDPSKKEIGPEIGAEDVGVIAQEVEALGLPGITTTRDDGTLAVRYERLVPILIEAIKELSAKVTALEGS